MSERSGGADTVREVKTTTVRLPDDLADELEAQAKRQGVSTSELVREGVVLRLALAAAAGTGGIDVLRAIERRLGDQR
jgi:Arc/MetJ-type ribon-helix-helix transcriptional regulator